MTRAIAARMLAQLLISDVVGHLLDVVGDRDLRDKVLKVLHHARGLAVDEDAAEELDPR